MELPEIRCFSHETQHYCLHETHSQVSGTNLRIAIRDKDMRVTGCECDSMIS